MLDPASNRRVAVATVCGCLFGFGAGLASQHLMGRDPGGVQVAGLAAPTVLQAPPTRGSADRSAASLTAQRPVPGPSRSTAPHQELEALEHRLRAERAWFLTRWGRPPIEPDALAPGFEAYEVEERMERLLEGRQGELISVNCTPYPCRARLIVAADGLMDEQDLADLGYAHATLVRDSVGYPNQWYDVTVTIPQEALDERESQFAWQLGALERFLTEQRFHDVLEALSSASGEEQP